MIFEDLHWIDPTSRELLDVTIEKITDLRLTEAEIHAVSTACRTALSFHR